jgi:hypothetical protein
MDLAAAWALACDKIVFSAMSSCLNTGTDWVYIGLVMGGP